MKKIAFTLMALFFLMQTYAQNTAPKLVDEKKMEWWKEAKFGMFIHWGLYAVPAGVYQDKPVKGIGEWIMNTAKIPVAEYQKYAPQFNPDQYDPEAWVKMAKDAGMKYIIITSKHHDGFAMFDSKVTKWDIMDSSPYKKDILKPLVEACRKAGIKIGFYYSQAQDWTHPGGAVSGGAWDEAQKGNFDTYLDKVSISQVKEILSNYGEPDILWWDTPQNMTPERAAKFEAIIKYHPNLITNNRLGGGYNGDTETPEQFVPSTGFPGRNWEACMTINDTWGFKSTDHDWKSTKTLIRNLTDIVSKGGNFLLNVGPDARGQIPSASIERLAEMGKWIKVNQEAIYGTTASPFPYLSWGRATRKQQKLYLHVFDNPKDGKLKVPMLNKVKKAYLLSDVAKELKTKRSGKNLEIMLPGQLPDTINTVVVLEFIGEPDVAPSPVKGKNITASSEQPGANAKNLLDANRLTKWEAAKGQKDAILEIDLARNFNISTLIIDEPWHPWEDKKQEITLEYKKGEAWLPVVKTTTGGIGFTKNFEPVTARYFRLNLHNGQTQPTLLEWQLYGPE
ncbi:alpha-L-fucosidase [Pedobacter psychrodurus]|uniref:alpha-L-fucosidase n=1 Tax=Pedobacter psychrodurus TaxID=2530456 RepID=UPI0013F16415|nr:alpha-L-fucosidase [Pedobacter psychrodurus]